MSGITTEGFVAKTFEQIKSEIESDQRAAISPKLNTSSASLLGKTNDIHSSKLRELWTVAKNLYDVLFTDAATGFPLSLRAALTGTLRGGSTYSRVLATVEVEPGTYPAGTLIASVDGHPNDRFSNLADVVNAGDVASNVEAVFVADRTGPVRANAEKLIVRAQATTGWNSITNARDAELGASEESDADLRARRRDELRAQGSTSLIAIKADIERDVDGVKSCTILENDTNTTDGNGLPGHSIEAIVYGPEPATESDDQAVAETLWSSKAACVGTHGNTTRTVVDRAGRSREVRFTRPTTLPIYVELSVEVAPDTYAGDDAVKEALADAVDELDVGEMLDWRRLVSVPYRVPGVLRVTAFGIDDAPGGPFTEQDIDPGVRAIVTLETSHVTVLVA